VPSFRQNIPACVLLLVAFCSGCATQRDTRPPQQTAPEPPRVSATERTVSLGTSVKGQPLTMYVFGDGPDVTFVFAAIHGDEPTAAYVGQRLLEVLRAWPDLDPGRTVALLPLANPDAVAAGTRANANGVDCNRNFPASNWKTRPWGRANSGSRPGSEPETAAVMQAVETLKPARIVSIHSGLRCNNPDGPPEAGELAAVLARHNGYPVQASVGYPTPGSFGSWAGNDLGIAVVTLELPRHSNGEKAWAENREGLLAVMGVRPAVARSGP
jgi:protein MpaA